MEYNQDQLDRFWSYLRSNKRVFPNGFQQSAVTAIEKIIKRTMHLSRPEAAYVLATPYHEVGPSYVPVRENMNYSAARIREVWPNRPEAVQYAGQPENLANSVYANRMGNGNFASGDGWKYRGGGLVQLTGKSMYEKFGVDADSILDIDVSIDVLVRGMEHGMFTGLRLGSFNLPAEFVRARTIVNNDVSRVGEEIAITANAFLGALMSMGEPRTTPVLEPKPEQPVVEGPSEVPLKKILEELQYQSTVLNSILLAIKERA